MFTKQLTEYINACFTGIWVETQEPDEAEREIAELGRQKNWRVYRWDVVKGMGKTGEPCNDPGNPLLPLQNMPLYGDESTTILILHNFHKFLSNVVVMQELFNRLVQGKASRAIIIVLAPIVQLPIELEKMFVILDHALPTIEQLDEIAAEMFPEARQIQTIASAAGLTRHEAEGAFALSIARHAEILPDEIWELKASMLKKCGLLEMHRGNERFADLGGLDSLKAFCKRALTPGRNVKPKGLLLLGVPGTGKSAFAKALGNETSRPTLTLDIGAMKGSLVGQTEANIRRALKIADAMAPCVLFVDEIEKALAGATSGHQGDSGVSADSQVKTFNNPEGPNYDRWEPVLEKQTWAQIDRWVDMILFGSFETFTEKANKRDTKAKATGGQDRVIHTERHAAFDAGNRYGLPAEIECGDSPKEAWSNFIAQLHPDRKK